MARLTKEQIKHMADRAEARSADLPTDDDDAEWERGFDETCDKAVRERSREIIEAEIERLAHLTPIEYELERRAAADRLDIRPSVLDGLVRAKRPKEKKFASKVPDFDPDELKRTAGHLIKHPDILSLFVKDFSKVIAGEAMNGKLLYLVATSRLFDKPMNAAIKGTSAGGKSEIRKRVLDFFPPEDVVTFTSLSEKSLIYYDGDFTHKVLSMGEATATDEKEFQDYLLRELMSEGHIRHSTVQKVGADFQAITIEKHGPVAFLVTTTKSKLHPENETRMLSLEIDDSEDQTKKVLNKVAQVDGLHDVAAVDYKPWQDFQRWLGCGERRVVVPFAAVMVELIPPVAVRLRRDVGQVICAIKAHALIHRDQRDRDDAQIVADIEHDYDAVRKLMTAIVAEGSGVAINVAIAETIDAVSKATIGMDETEGANAKVIAKLLKLDRSAAWRRLSAACDEGYVVNLEQRARMPGKYRTTGQKIEPMAILPLTADLVEAYNNTSPSLSPLKSMHSCNRDEIAEIPLSDSECKDSVHTSAECKASVHECTRVQIDLALANHLNGNEKSPPVARVHDFSGDTDTDVCAALFRSDIEDAYEELALREDDLSIPPNLDRRHEVCAQCGQPGGTEWDYRGIKVRLHERCEQSWIDAYEASGAT